MKKILLLIPLIFLITGCRVDYKIEINKDLSVVEQINMTETSETFSRRYKEFDKTVLNSIFNSGNRKETLTDNNYQYEESTMSSYPSILATKTYSSLDEFSKNTIFKDEFFGSVATTTEGSLITFIANDLIEYDSENIDLYDVSECVVSITLPYVVSSNNADSYDKKTNTYKWKLSSQEPKEIKITFDKNKIYVYNVFMYISLFIIILILLVLIIIGFKMHKKNVFNNKM